MSRRAQKLPDEYQEGSYKRRKSGKISNVGKPIKTSTRDASGPSGSRSQTSARSQPPPVPLQHFGEQNDMDTGLDYFGLDPQLPTLEEVRRSYGKVRFQIYLEMNGLSYSRLKISTWKCGSQNALHICGGLSPAKEPKPTPAFGARWLLVGGAEPV